jgi:hypothetical protein
MAQWIRRLPTEQEIQGSNPCKTSHMQTSYNGQYNTLWPCKSRFDSGCLQRLLLHRGRLAWIALSNTWPPVGGARAGAPPPAMCMACPCNAHMHIHTCMHKRLQTQRG